jgi:Amt family ammonium transporter
VHINAGAAALALALVIGRRKGWPHEAMSPHSLPLTLIGTGILWFGWFGFNAGSALGANNLAAAALMNTNLAAAAAMLGWLLAERLKAGHATTLGGASGVVAGLVAITPCAGFVTPIPAMIIGFIAGVVCLLAVQLKFRFGYDDALDVVGIHLVGGVIGSLLLGLFAQETSLGVGTNGLLFGGGMTLLLAQLAAVVATLAYSFLLSLGLGAVIDRAMGLRVTPEEEAEGLDLSQHSETAYQMADSSI